VYLNTHSYYSYKYGTISPEQVMFTSHEMGMEQIAVTEINNTSSAMDFIRLGQKHGFRVAVGIDFRNGNDQQYIGLAINNDGFYELNKYLTKHLHQGLTFMPHAPSFYAACTIYPFSKADKVLKTKLRENEYIGVRPCDLNKLRFSPWYAFKDKLVMLHTATFRNKSDFNAHRLLRAIDNNTLLSKLEKSEEGNPNDLFISKQELLDLYAGFPYIIENTMRLLDQCHVEFGFGQGQNNNIKTYTGSLRGDLNLLKQKCKEGLPYRYSDPSKEILERVDKEIDIISKKQFVSYFLVNWDIVKYAQQKKYFYVGRGSGANSIVAYLLRITDVDPVELDLYFERFINLYRTNPPDFDIDFSWTDREDITRYIFNTFQNTALLGTYNTFQLRSVVRELGKVFGMPKHEIDALSAMRKNPRDLDGLARLVMQYSHYIHEFPSHLSVHSSGIIITDRPTEYFSATFMPPKGFPTAQFDMLIAEDAGILKFDILSQRGLGKIKDAVEIAHQNQPGIPRIDIHDIKKFKKDEKVKGLLREGQAMGCFYVESPAMRMLMKKLRVDNYLGLVAASSIIRPGVARSGMMREYILRYRFPEQRERAHPVMQDIMPETYGVMVYQEDVIKVAHYFAGLSLAEADVLRRAMSGKFRSREEFQKVKDKFFLNCFNRGYPGETTYEIWYQIESFAGYAFSKGHSASYAVESFQSLYLKAHFPLEFMVAVVNNSGGFYRTEHYFHEARMHGANILPPCVNNSHTETVIKGKDIYLGLDLLGEAEHPVMKKLVEERVKNGPFESFNDFIDRVPITVEQLSILIRIEAFRFTGINKRELLWHARLKKPKLVKPSAQLDAFRSIEKKFTLPPLENNDLENIYDQLEILGFPLVSPFKLLREPPDGYFLASQFKNNLGKTVTLIGYLVTIKYTRTTGGKTMFFATFTDYEGHFFDTTHFPPVVEKYPFRGQGLYKVTGKVVEEFDFYSIEVLRMNKEPLFEDPRYSEMRYSKKVTKKK
jgi:error-prone DNA polymerase